MARFNDDFFVWFNLEFKTGRYPILVATDVAARGLGKMLLFDY